MPCYQVITASVEFKVGNIEILKRALAQAGMVNIVVNNETISFKDGNEKYSDYLGINLNTGKMLGVGWKQEKLSTVANSIKRAYSLEVINEISKKNKWIKKNMGENRYQLQRF